MRISAELRDELIAHAREDAPNECCGMLGGRDDTVTTVYRGVNKQASPMRFEIEYELGMLNRIEAAGEEHLAIYHSHPKTPAEPSQTDINLATRQWPDPLWVICSLQGPEPVVRAFRIRDHEVEEVELDVG